MNSPGAADPSPNASIVFPPFRIDLNAGRLVRGETPVPLRPKTWSVLVYLAERPGRLVTRDELLDAVWPDVAVTPDTVTKSIGELRVALGDDSRTPRCIETVHRRGFRFIAQAAASAQPAPVRGTTEDWPRAAIANPIVGREAELAKLSQAFARAAKGTRQVVFVTGAAGMGKTSLIDSFVDGLGLRPAEGKVWIARGACVDLHGAREAYMPVLAAVDGLARSTAGSMLIERMRRIAPTWLAQMPWLLDEKDPLRQPLALAGPERMLREFAALSESLPADITLVLVLEDLHWSDPSTVDLLAFVAQRREPARLLVIGSYRPAEVVVHGKPLAQVTHTLHMRRQCIDVPVHELRVDDIRHHLETRFPGADFAAPLASKVHGYTDGYPLFVVAVIEHMLTHGWILETDPGWALSISPESADLGVPDDVRQMIQMQIQALSPAERALLEVGSVVGSEFGISVIAGALGCAAGDVEVRCDALAHTHSFLRPQSAPMGRYAFAHELYRNAAYELIPASRRRTLHLRVGEALEATHSEGTGEAAAELALHFECGGDAHRAVGYFAAAAARARKRYASREAVGYLESALALAAELEEGPTRDRRELELRLALGAALSDLEGFTAPRVRSNLERAELLCTRGGDPAVLFDILYALGHVHIVGSDGAAVAATASKLEALAQRSGTPEHRLLLTSLRMRAATDAGDFAEVLRQAETMPPLPDRLDAPLSTYAADPLLACEAHSSYAYWAVGQIERADAAILRCNQLAQTTSAPFTRSAVLFFTALVNALNGRMAASADVAEDLIRLTDEHGFQYWNALARSVRAWARSTSNQISDADAVAEIEEALKDLRATHACLFSSNMLGFLADIHLRAGHVEAGLAAADEGLALAERMCERNWWSELWRLKGELLLSAPAKKGRGAKRAACDPQREQEADDCFRRAREVAHAVGARSFELRAAISQARAWSARGLGAEARAALSEVCEDFGGGAAGSDLDRARALLGSLR